LVWGPREWGGTAVPSRGAAGVGRRRCGGGGSVSGGGRRGLFWRDGWDGDLRGGGVGLKECGVRGGGCRCV